jgi:hypothetical protein
MSPTEPTPPGTGARRSPGSVWLQQRPKAWLWAAAFVVVVLAGLVVLFGVDPQP